MVYKKLTVEWAVLVSWGRVVALCQDRWKVSTSCFNTMSPELAQDHLATELYALLSLEQNGSPLKKSRFSKGWGDTSSAFLVWTSARALFTLPGLGF